MFKQLSLIIILSLPYIYCETPTETEQKAEIKESRVALSSEQKLAAFSGIVASGWFMLFIFKGMSDRSNFYDNLALKFRRNIPTVNWHARFTHMQTSTSNLLHTAMRSNPNFRSWK